MAQNHIPLKFQFKYRLLQHAIDCDTLRFSFFGRRLKMNSTYRHLGLSSSFLRRSRRRVQCRRSLGSLVHSGFCGSECVEVAAAEQDLNTQKPRKGTAIPREK